MKPSNFRIIDYDRKPAENLLSVLTQMGYEPPTPAPSWNLPTEGPYTAPKCSRCGMHVRGCKRASCPQNRQ